jgi:hypothetical protein
MSKLKPMTFNKAKARAIWQLGMIDEVIFMLDVIVLLMSQNIIVSILFLLKMINDFTTMWRKYLIAYKEEQK